MTHNKAFLLLLSLLIAAVACNEPSQQASEQSPEVATQPVAYPVTGSVERVSDKINQLISPDAEIQILAEGFEWSEGPVWVPEGDYLLFSDIPNNLIVKWKEGDSASVYLQPAGYTGENFEGREPGSNGLVLDNKGRLVLCQHGDRRLARMTAPLDAPAPEFETIVATYEGKRLNSPNDLAYHANGDLYFTDPPYGLPGGADSEAKELDFQGVYRYAEESDKLTLLTKELSRPNGIGFSPDGKTMYVANSDPQRAIWMAYEVTEDGVANERLFYDATDKREGAKGLPDGLAIHSSGHIFATGPGGVWIFTPEGEHIGTIKTGEATANCTFNEDESALYMTADMYLMRIPLIKEGA
ncbi:MAG: SMP-30/gluconolactonase/LRE family protein [Cyclobacteriaceae bacterium]